MTMYVLSCVWLCVIFLVCSCCVHYLVCVGGGGGVACDSGSNVGICELLITPSLVQKRQASSHTEAAPFTAPPPPSLCDGSSPHAPSPIPLHGKPTSLFNLAVKLSHKNHVWELYSQINNKYL